MILFIQIPCFNEEHTLEAVIADLPKAIDGIDKIEILVVDDGSTDNTIEKAKSLGVTHILPLITNQGLATAFRRGVEYALQHGADIVVNTDGDNQYCGHDIEKLCQPIVQGTADIVVGCRPILQHTEFSLAKKVLQVLGSWTLRKISKTQVQDASSGFRAFSRESLLRMFVYSKFSYCMETLIQAGTNRLRVASVDIRVNPKTRESRLFSSMAQYVFKSGFTIFSMFLLYRPTFFFNSLSLPFWFMSFALGTRALYLAWGVGGLIRDHLPSLLLVVIFSFIAILFNALAIIAELLRAQRRLTEELLCINRTLSLTPDKK